MEHPAAFVLAAGLGTRLRPITNTTPKPLVPIHHKPLISFALDSLIAAGVDTIALNTHHLPEQFTAVFGEEPMYRGHSLRLFYEPLLLDTGGGIWNARSVLSKRSFFLYNGDILADLPLVDLLAQHRRSGALATLLLLESGGAANVRFDAASGEILDLRNTLEASDGILVVYSGIALFDPAIFEWLPEGRSSIIDVLLTAMRAGERVCGMLVNRGLWMDIGTPAAYLEAQCLLASPAHRPSYIVDPHWPPLLRGSTR